MTTFGAQHTAQGRHVSIRLVAKHVAPGLHIEITGAQHLSKATGVVCSKKTCQRNRQTDRQTDGQTDRQTASQTDKTRQDKTRQTDKQAETRIGKGTSLENCFGFGFCFMSSKVLSAIAPGDCKLQEKPNGQSDCLSFPSLQSANVQTALRGARCPATHVTMP